MKSGLRSKFLIPTISLVLLGIAIQSLVSYFNSKQALKKGIDSQLIQITDSSIEQIDAWVTRNRVDIVIWSGQEVYRTAANDNFMGKAARELANSELAGLKENYGFYEDIHLVDANGLIVASSNTERIGGSISEKPFFSRALKGEVVISDVVRSDISDNPIFMISAPVKENDQVKAVLSGVVNLNAFSRDLVDKVKIGQTGYAYIYDREGIVVAHPDKSLILKLNMNDFDFGRDMMEKKEGLIFYTYEGVEKCVAFKTSAVTGWSVGVGAVTGEIFAPLKKIGYTSLVIAGVMIPVLTLALWFLTGKFILMPVSGAVEGLKDIAEGEGDLRNRLEIINNDEIGDLAKWFNVFIEKLHSIISKITENTQILNHSSGQLSTVAGRMSDASGNLTGKSAAVLASAEELSSFMASVASTMEQTSSSTQMISSATTEMTSTLEEISRKSDQARMVAGGAVSDAQQAVNMVEQLGNAAQDINKVTEAITEISEQTNLLALNATIEAARAGEAGKGFTVVANEIKELARQTAQSTLEIKNQITGIQNSSSDSIKAIEKISQVIRDVNDFITTIAASIEEQSVSTKEIANSVMQVSQGVDSVNNTISQSNASTRKVAEDISDMNRSAQDMSSSCRDVDSHTRELDNLSTQLNDLVRLFKI